MSTLLREPPRFEPSFRAGHVTRLLVALVLALLVIHTALQFDRFYTHRLPWQLQALFDLDEEAALPTWVSTAMLGWAAILCAGIAGARRRAGSKEALAWRGLAWIMAYLSMDEVAGVHETVNSLSTISWTIPFGILALVAACIYLPFVLRQRPDTRLGFFAFGFVYVMGAAGVEFLTSQFFNESNKRQFVYSLDTVAEEGMEMFGVVILLYTLMRLIERERAEYAAVAAAEAALATEHC